MVARSKYRLENCKYLKIPLSIFAKYKEAYGIEAWAESARDVLDMATHALPMKEDNKDE
jgi:hypothetical protein